MISREPISAQPGIRKNMMILPGAAAKDFLYVETASLDGPQEHSS